MWNKIKEILISIIKQLNRLNKQRYYGRNICSKLSRMLKIIFNLIINDM